MTFLYGSAAVVGGFLLMAFVGIRGLIAVFSSIPLARRKLKECPDFDLPQALHRIVRVALGALILMVILTFFVIRFAPGYMTLAFLSGTILGFLVKCGRISPNNEKNQRRFETDFEDCYDVSCPTVECTFPSGAREKREDP